MPTAPLEYRLCMDYWECAQDEQPLQPWLQQRRSPICVIVAEGFEQRSLGVLECLARAKARVSRVVVARYVADIDLNKRYRPRFEELAEKLSGGNWTVVENRDDGLWVQGALAGLASQDVLLDISGISNRALLPALDAAASFSGLVLVGYSEAKEYWPKESDWRELQKGLSDNTILAEMVDEKPWLFSSEHRVEIIPGHEGFDAAGVGHALVAFLPFKRARLGAVLGEEAYREFLFIAGRPRLEANAWRMEALRSINAPLTREWPVIEMSTFGYRPATQNLASTLLDPSTSADMPDLLSRYDVHLAAMGSKLQTVACWVLSSIVRSLTVVTSVPKKYYPEAFSEGIGESWVFALTRPQEVCERARMA